MKKIPIIVKCEVCGKDFDKSLRRGNAIHNFCSNECKHIFLANLNKKHSLAHKTKLYGVWKSMKQRCYNANDKSYKNYGARGITICEEWKNSFQAFYEWAIQNGYCYKQLPSGKNAYSIDRINNNGNYCPSNCKWSIDLEQASNKQKTIPIEEKQRICPICNSTFLISQRSVVGATCSRKCGAILRHRKNKNDLLKGE